MVDWRTFFVIGVAGFFFCDDFSDVEIAQRYVPGE